jgi:large subunit ribosomal protein L14
MSIQKQTKLKVADNSGALEIMCFHIVGGTKKRTANVGDVIVAAVKKAIPGGAVKKGEVVAAVVVRTKLKKRRLDGSYAGADQNAAVILKSKTELEPKGSRVFGPVFRELRDSGFTKIMSLASGVI